MKVAVLGGGICGLYLAQKLAKAGHKVEVFEQKTFIGKQCCSGLFSERLFDFLPESRELVENRINRCLIHFPKKTLSLAFRKKFYVIEHAKLDQMAARLAQKNTATITLGKKIDQTALENLMTRFDKVIGCDGALSVARKHLGLKESGYSLGIQVFSEKSNKSDLVETWPTENGFIWKIPRGESQEYGIMENPERARKIFDEFLEKNNLPATDLRSALIPTNFSLPSNERITLCGDASGLTKPWSGGGVVWGLKSADILLKNFPNFLQYKMEAERFFNLEISAASAAKKTLYWLGYNAPYVLPTNYSIDGDYLFKWTQQSQNI